MADTAGIPAPGTRRELHHRGIDMRGYERADGLFEVEGWLVDHKPHDYRLARSERVVPAGEAIHDMGLRLVFDGDLLVHEVHSMTRAAPYGVCPDGGRALQALVGLRIGAGWSREIRERLRPQDVCTHLRELLVPMATAAIQSLGARRAAQPEPQDPQRRPAKVDSCYAYAAHGEIVRLHWPRFHVPEPGHPFPNNEEHHNP